MVFLPLGNHSFKVFVLEINCQNLINYGLTVYRKNLDYYPGAADRNLLMKKNKPLLRMYKKVTGGTLKEEIHEEI